jgi:putative tricarboxylic transport membrane protein
LHSDPSEPSPDRVEVAVASGVVALGFVVVGGIFTIGSGVRYDRIGPRFFPYLVAAGLLLSGVFLLREALSRKTAPDSRNRSRGSNLGILTIALASGVLGLDRAGFILTSVVVFWLVARAFGSRRIWRDALAGVVLSVIVYLAFTRGLGLPLPAGIFQGLG